MRTRTHGEEGIALLVVMVLMGVMLTTGLALVSTVDTQTSASQKERTRDSAFNLAESALNAQIFLLGRDWAGLGTAGTPYQPCTQASSTTRCPDNASLVQSGSPDLAGATWTTSVRDNSATGGVDFYSDTQSATQPPYDSNDDGRLWVRAQATIQGRTRTLVGLVRSERQEEDLPHAALIANSLDITNNGNKELIRSGNGTVAVRCNPFNSALPNYRDVCLGHALTGANKTQAKLLANLAAQITGTTPTWDYTGGAAMTPEARLRLKATAIADGTYFTGCPTAAQLTGDVVYIESGNCTYVSNSQFNSAQSPGVLIIASGSISFGGTSNYYGVVYNATVGPAAQAVQTQGNAQITGGVIIDGNGEMVVGSSGLNIQFDLNAYRAVASYGSAGVIQNTWREIKPA